MIKTVFWGFVLFLAVSFFGISLRAIVESPAGQQNLAFVSQLAASFWHWLVLVLTLARVRILGA